MFNCITTQNTKDGFESKLNYPVLLCSSHRVTLLKILIIALPVGEPSYPRLRVLLHFDTQEFLNVLSMVSQFISDFVSYKASYCIAQFSSILSMVSQFISDFVSYKASYCIAQFSSILSMVSQFISGFVSYKASYCIAQ